jgi:hypothetical protein
MACDRLDAHEAMRDSAALKQRAAHSNRTVVLSRHWLRFRGLLCEVWCIPALGNSRWNANLPPGCLRAWSAACQSFPLLDQASLLGTVWPAEMFALNDLS